MKNIISYCEQNRQRFADQLMEFLKIPSVSAKPEHVNDVRSCAEYLKTEFARIGFQDCQIYQTDGHPIVYAEWVQPGNRVTVLIYGHYDVQPVDPLNEWNNPPFDPVVIDGKVYARGATDDKGQLYTHVKAIESYLAVKKSIPVNLKILVEGEEEVGSRNLETFISSHKESLSCDTILVSDNPMFAKGIPSIGYGLRGLVYAEVEVIGASHDLHSGTYGGAVPNPANILMEIIASLKTPGGKVTIPGFYDDVIPLTSEEHDMIQSLPFEEKNFLQRLNLEMGHGEKGYSTLERIWARPTLDVNGIYGGYMEEGAKTVIPARATAKVSMRIVPDQEETKIFNLFKEHVLKISPPSVKVEIRNLHGGEPYLAPLDTHEMHVARDGLEKGFGVKPVFIREGGSIPIVTTFKKTLHRSPILIGYGLPDENTHAPNEHFDLDNFFKGILSNIHLYDKLGD